MSEVPQEILDRYDTVLSHYTRFAVQSDDHPTRYAHLRWMLVQIPTLENDKAHRWLGFVQGVMRCAGLIDVNVERDFTRPLFKKD